MYHPPGRGPRSWHGAGSEVASQSPASRILGFVQKHFCPVVILTAAGGGGQHLGMEGAKASLLPSITICCWPLSAPSTKPALASLQPRAAEHPEIPPTSAASQWGQPPQYPPRRLRAPFLPQGHPSPRVPVGTQGDTRTVSAQVLLETGTVLDTRGTYPQEGVHVGRTPPLPAGRARMNSAPSVFPGLETPMGRSKSSDTGSPRGSPAPTGFGVDHSRNQTLYL